jgi:hypothetical protein
MAVESWNARQYAGDTRGYTGVSWTPEESAAAHHAAAGLPEEWETVRAMTLRVGDVLPVGELTELKYFGTVGVSFTAGGQSFHRGPDALVDRRVIRPDGVR